MYVIAKHIEFREPPKEYINLLGISSFSKNNRYHWSSTKCSDWESIKQPLPRGVTLFHTKISTRIELKRFRAWCDWMMDTNREDKEYMDEKMYEEWVAFPRTQEHYANQRDYARIIRINERKL